MNKTAGALILVSVLFLALGGYVVYDHFRKPVPVGTESVVATVAPAARKAPRVRVVVKAPVETIQGDAKANLKLPPLVQADSNQQVVAASQVRSDLHPQTVSTVLNTETGKVETFVKQDPYPWLAVETRGEASIAYGYKLRTTTRVSEPVARLQIGYDVLRAKALTLGVVASVDSDRDAFAGVRLSYRW